MLTRRGGGLKRSRRLLVVAPEVPRPDLSGGDLRTTALLCLMARRHRVDFYPLQPREDEDSEGTARQRVTLRSSGIRVLPTNWVFGLEEALVRRIYDAVLFEYWWCAEMGVELVSRHQGWAKILVDSLDIHFQRDQAGLSLGVSGLDPATVHANKQRELATYRSADAVVCVTDDDRRVLGEEGGISLRFTIPLVVPERVRSAGPRAPEVLFVGGFRHAPNPDGLHWFIRSIWPAIRAAIPAARITVVGSHPSAAELALSGVDGVDLAGYVPDVAPYLDRAALLVAPLRFGSGMKTKIVEAMAAGLPVVTTHVGTQGLDVTSGEQLMIADEPAAFAERVVAVLSDAALAEQVGQSGRRYVNTLCAPAVIDACLEAMLDAVIDEGRPSIPPRDWFVKSARMHVRRARVTLGQIRRSTVLKFFCPKRAS